MSVWTVEKKMEEEVKETTPKYDSVLVIIGHLFNIDCLFAWVVCVCYLYGVLHSHQFSINTQSSVMPWAYFTFIVASSSSFSSLRCNVISIFSLSRHQVCTFVVVYCLRCAALHTKKPTKTRCFFFKIKTTQNIGCPSTTAVINSSPSRYVLKCIFTALDTTRCFFLYQDAFILSMQRKSF